MSKESAILRSLHSVRENCHQAIYELVSKQENVKVLKEPNPNNRLHPACKAIVVVGSAAEAAELRDRCEQLVKDANDGLQKLVDQSSKSLIRHPLRYKIRVIDTSGALILSMQDAEYRKTATGEEIIGQLYQCMRELNTKTDAEQIEDIKAFCKTLDRKKRYTYARRTGCSYRLSYFDQNEQAHRQISVGNILIAISDTGSSVTEATKRKPRSDRKTELFQSYIHLYGIVKVYAV